MATSERIFHLSHVVHQPFSISSVCPIVAQNAMGPSMEPLDG